MERGSAPARIRYLSMALNDGHLVLSCTVALCALYYRWRRSYAATSHSAYSPPAHGRCIKLCRARLQAGAFVRAWSEARDKNCSDWLCGRRGRVRKMLVPLLAASWIRPIGKSSKFFFFFEQWHRDAAGYSHPPRFLPKQNLCVNLAPIITKFPREFTTTVIVAWPVRQPCIIGHINSSLLFQREFSANKEGWSRDALIRDDARGFAVKYIGI